MSNLMIYRLWDKKLKKFWHDFRIHPQGFVAPASSSKDGKWIYDWDYPQDQLVLTRQIGLKDINKQEVYGGDIVKYIPLGSKKTILAVVDWISLGGRHKQFCALSGFAFRALKDKDLIYSGGCKRAEIIGNIFENKNLLK